MLRHGQDTHLSTLMKAQELYEQHTGINDWKNIPEEYWNMALEEMKVPEYCEDLNGHTDMRTQRNREKHAG